MAEPGGRRDPAAEGRGQQGPDECGRVRADLGEHRDDAQVRHALLDLGPLVEAARPFHEQALGRNRRQPLGARGIDRGLDKREEAFLPGEELEDHGLDLATDKALQVAQAHDPELDEHLTEQSGRLRGLLGGARLLDGYAGTGAIGIEAFSRGARSVAFVDRDPRARRLIARNVEHCGIPSGCVIIRSDFDRLDQFDIVVLDPPYDDQPEQVILGTAHLVAPGGMLVLEHAKRQPGPDAVSSLTRTRRIAAGDSALSFYEQPASPAGAAGTT